MQLLHFCIFNKLCYVLTTKKTLMALFVSSIGKKHIAEAIGPDFKA